jgi:hypothetical protein
MKRCQLCGRITNELYRCWFKEEEDTPPIPLNVCAWCVPDTYEPDETMANLKRR